jgi:hypothetical protein
MRAVGRLDYFATLPIYRSALILATVLAFLIMSLPSVAMTLILGLAFSLGMLQISIGGVSTADIATKNEVALLVGMLCGISEQALPATLNDQANKLLRPER